MRKQSATGRTRDGASFPLCIALEIDDNFELTEDDDDRDMSKLEDTEDNRSAKIVNKGIKWWELSADKSTKVYKGVIWVFSNISGLVTFLPDGTVHNINDNFSLMLFGYKSTDVIDKVSVILINWLIDTFIYLLTDWLILTDW